MKIAFVGNYQYNCGSSNALLGYVNAGKILGHDVRVSEFGYIDEEIRKVVPVAERSWDLDILVIVYESYPFLSNEDLDEIRKSIPRSKILLIDPDCKYLEPSVLENDTNHPTPDSYEYWTTLYDSLSDKILQPTLDKITKEKVSKFIYFGIDADNNFENIKKDFDFLYVGNNWYRWDDITKLAKSTNSIRNVLKRIGVMGSHWDEKVMKGFEEATYSDPNFLKANNVEILKSAPYGKVESSMSRGLINPIYIRPILNKLKLVTPRMLETFAADTVPVIPEYFAHASELYGDTVKELVLSNEKLLMIMKDYKKYSDISKGIRNKLVAEHSYEVRLKELIKFV
ncbi:MAG: hypothetical protein QY322_00685 [bacterium]|nr:MAG: hypothetical protein QY322_00685 [bacterium]